MDAPSQRNLDKRQLVLLGCFLGNLECLERRVFEVAITVHAAEVLGFGPKMAFLGLDIFGLDLAREEAAGKGIVDDNIDAILAASWNELRFNGSS